MMLNLEEVDSSWLETDHWEMQMQCGSNGPSSWILLPLSEAPPHERAF